MCTAITFKTNNHYFGRNLDFEYDFNEQVIITPRNKTLDFKYFDNLENHHAIIGIGINASNYPLYFDATNEHGLSIAGLNFPGNAYYFDDSTGIAPFELTPWLLAQCKSIRECMNLLKDLRIINAPFNKEYALSPLHWLLADKHSSIVLEPTTSGLRIYENPVGVLTNNPPFDYHLYNLSNFMNITSQEATNRFAPHCKIEPYSRGMGAIGLPGDNSSASRFVRATFTKLNSISDSDEHSSITQFFHILNSVCQVDGCTQIGNDFEKTIYSSCCNTDKGIYYYTTYENCQITAVNMYNYDIDSNALISVPLNRTLQIANAP